MLTGLYLGSGIAILGVASLALFSLQRAVGVPPPVRGHRLNPFLSPALALMGVLAFIVLLIPFSIARAAIGSGIAWDGIAWLVLCAACLVVVAYLTARWWQPLYLSAVLWTFFTVGALYEHYEGINEPEGQTARGLLIEAASALPVLAALTSVGVLLAFLHLRASQRPQRPPANAWRPLGGVSDRPDAVEASRLHPRVTAPPSAPTSWVAEESERARELLDRGEASEAVHLLAEAERGAVAQGYPELLPTIRALADDVGSRSEGRTRRQAQRIVERIDTRARKASSCRL